MNIEEKIDEIVSRVKKETISIYPKPFDRNLKYHTMCGESCKIDGLWMEFGVHRGRSITHFSKITDKVVYGFDSFEGLPEDWIGGLGKTAFSLNGIIPKGPIIGNSHDQLDTSPTKNTGEWEKNIELVKGWFDDSLPKFINRSDVKDENIAFLHIDCDLYSSTKTIFKFLGDKIVDGTVIAFDELFGYPEYREHEIKAFAEFLIETGLDYKPLYHILANGMTQGCIKIINNRNE